MPTRNTVVLGHLIEALGPQVISPTEALARLEQVYTVQLLIVAGDVPKVMQLAEQLRLFITTAEAGQVLDHIGSEALAGIIIDQTEEVINALFSDRFIEP